MSEQYLILSPHLLPLTWLSEQRKIRKVRSRGYIDKKSQDNRNVKYATEINEAKSAWGTFSIRTSFPCLQGQSFLRKQRFLKPNQWDSFKPFSHNIVEGLTLFPLISWFIAWIYCGLTINADPLTRVVKCFTNMLEELTAVTSLWEQE